MTSEHDQEMGWAPANVDLSKPSVARIYDYLLGGKDHWAPDREAAQTLLTSLPTARDDLHANRAVPRPCGEVSRR